MQMLRLTQGKTTVVDDADFLWLSRFRWYYARSTGYARTTTGGRKFNLHQMLLPCTPGLMPDHINRDKLDNRRVNLRLVTKSENNRNKGPQANNTSGVLGVTRHSNGSWVAQASLNGRNYYISSHKTLKEALAARVNFLDEWRVRPESITPKGPLHRNNTSGFRGVYPQRLRSGNTRWAAQAAFNGRHKHIGMFADPEEAAKALRDFYARA